jgi:ribosomal protein S18 acetylase RimI-like enzyme
MEIEISQATQQDLEALLPLFSEYRTFYEQDPDPEAERRYLSARMEKGDCTVFIARANGLPAGFVLLYPTFDSVDLASIWVLHDLCVTANHRRQGIGRELMQTAHEFCRNKNASRVDLSTAVTNTVAQPLYESMGYVRDEVFYSYSLSL